MSSVMGHGFQGQGRSAHHIHGCHFLLLLKIQQVSGTPGSQLLVGDNILKIALKTNQNFYFTKSAQARTM